MFGIARLSRNWLVARFATVYVEGLRNIPVLLQLFFWYSLITEALPGPRQALNPLPGVFLSARGLKLPEPVWQTTHLWMGGRLPRRHRRRLGRRPLGAAAPRTDRPAFPVAAGGRGADHRPAGARLAAGGAPTAMDMPELRGFNFAGGLTVTPEFTALLVGLVLYTGTFIAEIVRGGILAVAHGQTEAGLALGLSRGQVLRLIILPQALRVIIPPLTSQYLNLTKNSSLAVAIGFPDLVSVANTAINQTGQAVEGIAVIMAVYLTVSLSISTFMNWYNRRIAAERRPLMAAAPSRRRRKKSSRAKKSRWSRTCRCAARAATPGYGALVLDWAREEPVLQHSRTRC